MTIDNWIRFWTALCLIGCVGFYLVALIVLPLGLRDLMRLFARLSGQDRDGPSEDA